MYASDNDDNVSILLVLIVTALFYSLVKQREGRSKDIRSSDVSPPKSFCYSSLSSFSAGVSLFSLMCL